MSFWENVDSELKYQNKTRKQLANTLKFDPTTISKGISSGSIPQADTALKIANYLNVSLEYLLDLPEIKNDKIKKENQEEIRLYREHHELIEAAKHLNTQQTKALIRLISTINLS